MTCSTVYNIKLFCKQHNTINILLASNTRAGKSYLLKRNTICSLSVQVQYVKPLSPYHKFDLLTIIIYKHNLLSFCTSKRFQGLNLLNPARKKGWVLNLSVAKSASTVHPIKFYCEKQISSFLFSPPKESLFL